MIKLRDNRFGDFALAFEQSEAAPYWYKSKPLKNDPDNKEGLGGQKVSTDERKVLVHFGNKALEDLETLADGAILDLSETHLETGNRKKLKFFEFRGKEEEGPFRLITGNLMGVLRFRHGEESLQVEVLSRFDRRGNNFFLNYLLSKAFDDVSFANDSVSATKPSVLDRLLDVLFVRRLGEAAKNGLLRQYRTYRNNDWNFKGRLDLPRHIRENVPLPHGIAYVKREIDLDVPVNRLLLLAALVVRKRNPDLFEWNEDARDALRELQTAIPNPGDVRSVLSQRDSREPVRHPFYREIWEPLRKIARMILEEERWQLFRESDEEVSGVVFDGSWLWEEYIARVLAKAGFRHCRNVAKDEDRRKSLRKCSTQKDMGPMVPDFAPADRNRKWKALVDAKYKFPQIGRDDRLQMIAYAFVYQPEIIHLVYPPNDQNHGNRSSTTEEDDNVEFTSGDWFEILRYHSPESCEGSKVFLHALAFGDIPNVDSETSFQDFELEMDKLESKLLENLKQGPP